MSNFLYRRCVHQASAAISRARYSRGFAASTSASPFDWGDPLASKNLLTEDELAISEVAERYCQERLLPRVLRGFN